MNYVLPDNVIQPMKTDTFVAVEIKNLKHTSHIIKVLNDKYPLSLHKHLRRVKSINVDGGKQIHILICLSSEVADLSTSSHHDLLSDTPIDLADLSTSCYLCPASTSQPITRKQYEECKLLWPTFFHEDKELEGKLGLIEYSEFDRSCIALARETSARSSSSTACGAVIADVPRQRVVGVGYSVANTHPLRHAVMVAIDSVARGHGGGAWTCTPSSPTSSKLCEYRKRKSSDSATEGGYICTGYTAFLTHEPCTMCAMSLLHSRIKHVYYKTPTTMGALGSAYKLHCNPTLNHNFTVTTQASRLLQTDGVS